MNQKNSKIDNKLNYSITIISLCLIILLGFVFWAETIGWFYPKQSPPSSDDVSAPDQPHVPSERAEVFDISGAKMTPDFVNELIIDPFYGSEIGERQYFSVWVEDLKGVEAVKVIIKDLETDIATIDLELREGDKNRGRWEGIWTISNVVPRTSPALIFQGQNQEGEIAEIETYFYIKGEEQSWLRDFFSIKSVFAAACFPSGNTTGDKTISACSILSGSTVGTDQGNLNIGGTITMESNSTLLFESGYGIGFSTGAKILKSQTNTIIRKGDVPIPTCDCSSGACCSDGCNYDGTSDVCSTGTDYDYKCEGTGCGDDAQRKSRSVTQYCSGSSSSCTGSTSYGGWSGWSDIHNCDTDEKCSSDNSSYASCSYDSDCVVSKPDLKAMQVGLYDSDGGYASYHMGNIGNTDVTNSISYLFVKRSYNDDGSVNYGPLVYVDSDNTGSIAAGGSVSRRFPNWTCSDHGKKYDIRACGDGPNAISESNESNNCYAGVRTCPDNGSGPDPSPTLSVSLSVNPSSGTAPLTSVKLKATVSGSAAGNIHYQFDCNSDGNYRCDFTRSETTRYCYCDYFNDGIYTARVNVTREGQTAYGTATINVGTGCECSSGTCCSDGCNYDGTSHVCSTGTDYDYQCSGTGCGDDAQRRSRSVTQYCSGSSSSCTGSTSYGSWSGWSNIDNCTATEKCSSNNSTYANCSYDSSCVDPLNALPDCPFSGGTPGDIWMTNCSNYCDVTSSSDWDNRCKFSTNYCEKCRQWPFPLVGDKDCIKVYNNGSDIVPYHVFFGLTSSSIAHFCIVPGATPNLNFLPTCSFGGTSGDIWIRPDRCTWDYKVKWDGSSTSRSTNCSGDEFGLTAYKNQIYSYHHTITGIGTNAAVFCRIP